MSNVVVDDAIVNQVFDEVLPKAIEIVSNKLNKKLTINDIFDKFSILLLKNIYYLYFKLLFYTNDINKIYDCFDITRLSCEYDVTLFYIKNDLELYCKTITNITGDNKIYPNTIRKWGFLGIFEDILMALKDEYPINVFRRFDVFDGIYDNGSIMVTIDELNIDHKDIHSSIEIKLEKLNLLEELEEKTKLNLYQFGGSLEGMMFALLIYHLHEKDKSNFYNMKYMGHKIDYVSYFEKHKNYYFSEKNIFLAKYTSIVFPFNSLINFEGINFIEGYNTTCNYIEYDSYIKNEVYNNRPEEEDVQ